jgi:hypothetical protein
MKHVETPDYKMTPEEEKEVDERIAAFFKEAEERRKKWEAMTPEEKEEYKKALEEKRKVAAEESKRKWEAFYNLYGDQVRALKKGESITLKCPECGGSITAERSSYNGHRHIICENRCYMMIE